MAARIVVVGSLNMDLVVAVERLPARGETVIGRDLQHFGGGKGANQAIAAARMGATVAMLGRVGQDEFGVMLLSDLRREGVDTAGVTQLDAPTGTALITVDTSGANTIVVAPGANHRLTVADVENHAAVIEAADGLLSQLEVPIGVVTAAARIARAAGVSVFLNPSPAGPLPAELLESVDYLVLNQSELAVLDPVAADPQSLLACGVRTVVLTLGELGSRWITRDGIQDVAPFAVASVDTTAAGDAFVGALAAEVTTLGVSAALRRASAAGALATTRWGAQPSLPTADEVDRFLASVR